MTNTEDDLLPATVGLVRPGDTLHEFDGLALDPPALVEYVDPTPGGETVVLTLWGGRHMMELSLPRTALVVYTHAPVRVSLS